MLLTPRTTTLSEHTSRADDSELRPVHVAGVLRRLQATVMPERAITIALDLDESLHVAAHVPLLTMALNALLGRAIGASRRDARIVLRCRAEEAGVVIEIEGEGAATPNARLAPVARRRNAGLAPMRRALERMSGRLTSEEQPGGGHVLALHFPLPRAKPGGNSR